LKQSALSIQQSAKTEAAISYQQSALSRQQSAKTEAAISSQHSAISQNSLIANGVKVAKKEEFRVLLP
jgi:hypothetical protein